MDATVKKALIAMSGGVDSSVAAYLTQKAGYECTGCTMKLHDDPAVIKENSHTCCTLDDVEDARSVSRKLGMDFYVFNFKDGFREKIIDKFIYSYENGLTPNPCIDCNRFMKFDKLFERAEILGCNKVVTGHYARIEERGGRYVLLKAPDALKDQSYVLYSLTQDQLAHVLFPIGDLTKQETRKIAEENGFINSAKPDSQDICFVPVGRYTDVIRELTGKEYPEGDFVYKDGTVLGRHKGIICYTRGQRKGLGLASEEPLYVLRVDPVTNTVWLGRETDLYSDTLVADDFNWTSGQAPSGEIRCRAKVRYRQKEQPCTASVRDDGSVEVVFDEAQRAITPGQACVLYDGDEVLGGGTIRL